LFPFTLISIQESRAIAGRTARCHYKFRYVSNFTTASCGFLTQHGFHGYLSNAEIAHSTLIFTAVTQVKSSQVK